jgi:RNA polymerase sigma-70 factor (ECF subfamily)
MGLTLKELTDEELCAMVAQHSEQAFGLLVQRHQARAYRIPYLVLGNEVDARDISQDAFIRLFKSAHKFDRCSRFSRWFYRILADLCIGHARRGKQGKPLPPLAGPGDDRDQPGIDPPAGERPDAAAIRHQLSRGLDEALRRLSADQRTQYCCGCRKDFPARRLRRCSTAPRRPRGSILTVDWPRSKAAWK